MKQAVLRTLAIKSNPSCTYLTNLYRYYITLLSSTFNHQSHFIHSTPLSLETPPRLSLSARGDTRLDKTNSAQPSLNA